MPGTFLLSTLSTLAEQLVQVMPTTASSTLAVSAGATRMNPAFWAAATTNCKMPTSLGGG